MIFSLSFKTTHSLSLSLSRWTYRIPNRVLTFTPALTSTHAPATCDTESVSKLLRVLGVGEDNPSDILADKKIAEILANEPETSLAVCTIGPGPVTPDDLTIFHRKPLGTRRRVPAATATKIDVGTNQKNTRVLKTIANATNKKIALDGATTRVAKGATETTVVAKTGGAVNSKVGMGKSATGVAKSTAVFAKPQIGAANVDVAKSTVAVAGRAAKSMFTATKGEIGVTKPNVGAAKSTVAVTKQQVGVAKSTATVGVVKSTVELAKSRVAVARPKAGVANSKVGVAQSTVRMTKSTAGVTGSTAGMVKPAVGSTSRMVGGPTGAVKPNEVSPEQTVPLVKKKMGATTHMSRVMVDPPVKTENFVDRWVFSVTFPIFIVILVFYMLLVYKRIRLCSEIGEFILQLLE